MSHRIDSDNRRRFLKRALAATAGGAGLFADPGLLGLWPTLAAAPRGSDYKALVCVFLLGGNDGHNLVVARDPNAYASYAQHRAGLTIPREQLLPIAPLSGAPFALGLHPQMGEMASLFESGQLALVGRIGALLEPVTRTQYDERTVPLPPQLFSHNDQQAFWEGLEVRTGLETAAPSGWGGRLADLVASTQSSALLPAAMSMTGSHLFPVGQQVQPLSVSTSDIRALDVDRAAGANLSLLDLLGQSRSHPIVEHYRRTLGSAVDAYATLADKVAAASSFEGVFPPLPGDDATFADRMAYDLGQQLRRVAQLIERRDVIGHRRQVFFCALGAFDTHDAQSMLQPQLLRALSQALASFDQATQQLGLRDRVTTFTASEFGRSLTSNGDGSDHAWANHLFVMGGAVRGRHVYGDLPLLDPATNAFAGDGNMIPGISIDQYGATLARWFGLGENDIDTMFPRLGRFASRDLGFMLPG
jgi:uncharacterized protein (DUF1501 family)